MSEGSVIRVEFPPAEAPPRKRGRPKTKQRRLPQPKSPQVITDKTLVASPRGARIKGDTKLARYVRERGFSSHYISTQTNINTRRLTEYFAGRAYPSAEVTAALCKFFQCNPWDILE